MRGAQWKICVVALGLAVAGTDASAQVTRAPSEVHDCLCLEQSVTTLNERVQAERSVYEAKRQEFEALDQQVQSGRPKVNVNDPADVEAFKRLLERRDAAADGLAGPVTEGYAA